jgi:hypothetical protein
MLQRLRSVNQGNPDFGLRKPLDWCKVSCSRGRTLKVIRVEIAGVLNMSQPAISCSSRRGEKIAIENRFKLIDDGNAQKHKRYPFHCSIKVFTAVITSIHFKSSEVRRHISGK